jgi:hypothetical protein
MTDGVKFDFSELNQLAADLGAAPKNIGPYLHQAIETTSRHIKNDWNQRLYKKGHAKLTGHSITYDIEAKAGVVSQIKSEIGPVKGAGVQAGVVLLLEYGSIRNRPHREGAQALKNNIPDFEKGIADAGKDALK